MAQADAKLAATNEAVKREAGPPAERNQPSV
jgi:hypothetical protein